MKKKAIISIIVKPSNKRIKYKSIRQCRISPFNKITEALSYRKEMKVTHIHEYRNEDQFSVCPRCDKVIEREYTNFCVNCGQKLNWDVHAVVIIRTYKNEGFPLRQHSHDPHSISYLDIPDVIPQFVEFR